MHLVCLMAKISDAIDLVHGAGHEIFACLQAVSSDDRIFLLMIFLYEILPPVAPR